MFDVKSHKLQHILILIEFKVKTGLPNTGYLQIFKFTTCIDIVKHETYQTDPH